MMDVDITFYAFYGRRLKPSLWLQPLGYLRKDETDWFHLNPDVFMKSVTPRGK